MYERGALADLIYVVSEGELEMPRPRAGGGQTLRKRLAALPPARSITELQTQLDDFLA